MYKSDCDCYFSYNICPCQSDNIFFLFLIHNTGIFLFFCLFYTKMFSSDCSLLLKVFQKYVISLIWQPTAFFSLYNRVRKKTPKPHKIDHGRSEDRIFRSCEKQQFRDCVIRSSDHFPKYLAVLKLRTNCEPV